MSPPDDTVRYYAPDAPELAAEFLKPEEEGVLEAVNERVAAQESVEDILHFLFTATADLCPCDRVSIAFLQDDDQRVVSHATEATYDPLYIKQGYAADLHGSSLETVFERGALRIIGDTEAYLRAHPQSTSTKLLVKEGIRSNMTCPLTVDGRRVGFLFRSSRAPEAYGPHQAAMHLAVAGRLSQAVEKAWRIRQLRDANEAYLEMLSFVSHEIKNPLGSLIMSGQLLTDGYLGELPPKVHAKVAGMVHQADDLLGLVRDYLNLARFETGNLDAEFEDGVNLVDDVIVPALESLEPQREEKSCTVERTFDDDAPAVRGDAGLLRIVAGNLIGNAIKYGHDNARIRVGAETLDDGVRVAVWNEGPGFPAEQRNRLFKKFSRLQTKELRKRKGSGVGLYISWRIVQIHGGHMDARSEEGKWAEFSFRLPRAD